MGEAKNRGTFEQRRFVAIMRDKEAMEEKRKKAARFEERETFLHQTIMTPEERQRQFNTNIFISTLRGIAAAQIRKTK